MYHSFSYVKAGMIFTAHFWDIWSFHSAK